MKKMTTKLTSISLLIAAIFLNVSSVSAETLPTEHEISNVTDYGDGIKMSEYADRSGFEVEGGGARFIYDSNMKLMTCITIEGVSQTSFDVPQPTEASTDDASDQVASR